jgi:hypothetical protein
MIATATENQRENDSCPSKRRAKTKEAGRIPVTGGEAITNLTLSFLSLPLGFREKRRGWKPPATI